MAETEEVEVLKSFNKTPQGGGLTEVGEKVTVTTVRAGELERLGLAKRKKAKAASAAENKMAAEPENKSAGVQAAAAVERGTRRTIAREKR